MLVLTALTIGGAFWLNAWGGSYRDFSPAILVIAYAPTTAALVAVAFQRGGVRALLAQLLHWRTRTRWYVIALLGPCLLVLGAAAAVVALGDVARPSTWMALPSAATALTLVGPIVAGSFGEEVGWRGYAQPTLQSRFTVLTAAVIVGLVWSLWHLWPVLTPLGRADLTTTDVAQTVVRLVSTAVIYAWLYNSTGGALPVVLVAHAAHNTAVTLLPVDVIDTSTAAWTIALLYAAVAVAVIIVGSGRLAGSARGVWLGSTSHSAGPVSRDRGTG